MPRIKRPKELQEGMRYMPEDARFATPRPVAEYRAHRLTCNTLAEIGCGVGFQTAAFAKTCQRVVAIEADPRKADDAQANMKALGHKNVEVITGNALKPAIVQHIARAGPDIVFCDTQRPANEEIRRLNSIQPDPRKILKTYGAITPNIAIELPPHLQELPRGCEFEYLSLHNALNRLTIYCGALKQAKISAYFLPSEQRIVSRGLPKPKIIPPSERFTWLHEFDPTIVRAGLIAEAFEGTNASLTKLADKPYALAMKRIVRPWFKPYRILAITPADTLSVRESLLRMDAGKVTLHARIDPKHYWSRRREYEAGLTGEKHVHLFLGRKAVITESANQ